MKLIFSLVTGMCISISLYSQSNETAIPQVDVRREKFEDISKKLKDYMSTLPQSRDEVVAKDYVNDCVEKGKADANPSRKINKWLMEAERHLDENGYVVNAKARNFEEYLKLIKKEENRGGLNAAATSTSGQWHNLPVSTMVTSNWGLGRVNCLAMLPNDTNVIYAGCNEGGLWKTANAGATWVCLTNHLPVAAVAGIAINPLNNNNIYILSGNRNNNFSGFNLNNTLSIGVFVTYDGGTNWYQTGLAFTAFDNAIAGTMRMSPVDPNVLVATFNKGIYQTQDGGISWNLRQTGNFDDLEFKPGAATCYAAQSKLVFRSLNNGTTWDTIRNSSYPLFAQPTPGTNYIEIGVAPSSPSVVYLCYTGDTILSPLYKSNNSGNSFVFQSDVKGFANYQVAYNSAMTISPTNASVIYLGNFTVYKSSNSGVTFPVVAGAGFHADQQDLIALSDNHVVVANDGGVYITRNGTDWTFSSKGINNGEYLAFGGYAANSQKLLGGMWDTGSMMYDAGTLTGYVYTDQGEGMIKPTNPDTVYMVYALNQKNLTRKVGNGAPVDISPFNTCMCTDPGGANTNSTRTIYYNPVNPYTIYSVYGDFYISYNGGTSWIRKPRSGSPAIAMAQGTNDTSRIYIIENSRIYGSADYGNNWPLVQFVTGSLSDIIVNPNNKNEFYYSLFGYSNNQKVFKGNWSGTGSFAPITNISSGLPNVPVYKLLYQNTSTPGIYAATDIGVFFRSEASGVWEYFGGGLPYCKVTDLEINYGSNIITASTYGRGLWQSPLYADCPLSFNHGNNYILGSPYAHPFVAGQEYFEASNDIHSSIVIQGGFGVDVTYNAGNFVSLTDSFEVKEGSTFRAYNGGCNTPLPAAQLTGNFAGSMPGAPANVKSTFSGAIPIRLVPNPAQNNLQIVYATETDGWLELSLYDINGRMVMEVEKGNMEKGYHQKDVDLDRLSNGVYLVTLQSQTINERIKLVISK